jgi:SRSO17 transposase
MQRLLNFSPWDEGTARDALALHVAARMGDPAAVLAIDQTGFLKKGRMSAGVARMYTGTARRVENCQVGVFAAYVTPDGSRALIDREVYLPQKWTDDRGRCRAAGIGDGVAFTTKPELGRKMIERARDAGIPFAWITADEAYGGNPALRKWLEEQAIPFVMAVACDARIATAAGRKRGRACRLRAGRGVASAELRRRLQGTPALRDPGSTTGR